RKMWSLLKLTMLLVCIRVGQSGDQRPGLPEEPGKGGEGGEQEEGAVRPRRSAEGPCGLHSILLQVRDLGLGYDSDEVVLFKYCSGFCPRLTSNHDLTLANLQQSGALPHAATPGHHAPCCRPTHHEDMAFLDNAHRWHRVEKLSASACTCMG
uniref:TGF-beta family profile domain-containing protein n=1 Tax=Pygocentrus nattereri TaxID=42514 RepID=A0A3B4E803_PYGNA